MRKVKEKEKEIRIAPVYLFSNSGRIRTNQRVLYFHARVCKPLLKFCRI